MSAPFNRIYADRAIAICSREQTEQLVNYDHHVVDVNGRAGMIFTYEWMPVEEPTAPFILTVVFHHVEENPRAPQEIQSIVDGLRFEVRGKPR